MLQEPQLNIQQTLVRDIVTCMCNVDLALYEYHASVVAFMERFAKDRERRELWDECVGNIMLNNYLAGTYSPSYNTLRSIYYKIKKLKEKNELEWTMALMIFTWGGFSDKLEGYPRKRAPKHRKRRAIRIPDPETPWLCLKLNRPKRKKRLGGWSDKLKITKLDQLKIKYSLKDLTKYLSKRYRVKV